MFDAEMNDVATSDLSNTTSREDGARQRKRNPERPRRSTQHGEQPWSHVNIQNSLNRVTQPVVIASTEQRISPSEHENDASIVLVGMSGSGKTTLAVIASLFLGWKYADFTIFYLEQTGQSPTEYIQKHGVHSYRKSEIEIARDLFEQCARGHIIEIPSNFTSTIQSALLTDVAQNHPVIYVRRDKRELRDFISVDDDKFKRWYEHSNKVYSSCSSIDFHNMSADIGNFEGRELVPTLRLKRTETDFIRFLHRILGRPQCLLHSNDTLSPTFTYALLAPLTWLENHRDHDEFECGADAISFVIDVPHDSPDLQNRVAREMAYLRRFSRLPIILEMWHPQNDFSACLTVAKLGMRCLPDMIALDLGNSQAQLRSVPWSQYGIKLIGTLHREAPWQDSEVIDEILQLSSRAKNIPCSLLRITYSATSQSDNFSCISYAQRAGQGCDIPISIYNTGKFGLTSLCFNPILSPIVPSSFSSEGLTIQQAHAALHSCFVLTKKRFYIFGKSVSYSLSPTMHNAAYNALGMLHSYNYKESDNFRDIYSLFDEESCAGVAVTLPYKTKVLELLDYISPEAREIGAVNTILVESSKALSNASQRPTLKGYNTDHIALRECISQNLSPANMIRANTSALIIGAGGMARAALYACRTLGVKHFCIFNRTAEHAEELVRSSTRMSIEIHMLADLDEEWPSQFRHPTIIISTIPAHGIGNVPPHELEIPHRWLLSRTGGVFIELAYKPLITRFLRQMHSMHLRGWNIVDGLDVLVQQGIAQFEIFTGRPAPIHIMKRAVRLRRQEISDQN